MPVVLAGTAFAIDLSYVYYNKSRIQQAADAGALAAVLALPNTGTAGTQALQLVSSNTPTSFGTLSTNADVTFGTWDASTKTFTISAANQNAVQVKTHRTVANGNPILTFFGKFVGAPYVEVNATGTAVRFGGACVRVLDPSAAPAFTNGGSGKVSLDCALQVNSSSANAAQSQGSSTISTSSTCVSGGYTGTGWSPTPTIGCKVLADPLASIPEPAAPTSCTVNNPTVSSGTLNSNCTYTGTVSLSGSVTLQSGLLYFKNATINVSSSTNINGTGVTMFLDANSTLSLTGNGTISLSAPTSGTYAGLLIFQSRSTPVSHTLTIWGNGTMSLNGTLYAPSATLSMGGNATLIETKVGYVIADKLSLAGSSDLKFNAFQSSGVTPPTLAVHAALVN
ncbi:MAG: pilus assembly protein TadG-related protein [Beijerinckiaceae bacterium]